MQEEILHRRLGARNVLLQTDPVTKQVRAKLAGFGPLKGEQEGADENKSVSSFPRLSCNEICICDVYENMTCQKLKTLVQS